MTKIEELKKSDNVDNKGEETTDNVDDTDDETTDYNIVRVTMEDKIALGKASEIQTKLYGDRSEPQIVESKDEMIKTLSRFNNNKARNSIISNIAILNYFEALRTSKDPEMKSIYNSFLKIYSGARQVEEAVQKQRVLHQKAINEINKILGSGEITRQFFEKTYTNMTSLEDSKLSDLHAIDKNSLEKFQEIKNEMDTNQSSFSNLNFFTDEDFFNLSKLLSAEVNIMLLETKPAEMKALQDEIEIAQALTFEANREKFLLEKKLKLYELKTENTNEMLKRLAEKKESIEAELKLLEKSKLENNEKQMDLLKECNDPNKIKKRKEENRNACNALRHDFKAKLVEKVNEIDKEQKALLKNIKNVKTVMRHLHLIFLIDESGSMEGKDNVDGKNHYETVIDCVKACVEKRKEKQMTNDKFSVIKFNDSAEISILNRSVKEGFGEISAMRKGGTSFVEPIKKLAEILNENNFDMFIPVILFLSDGKDESKSKVLKQCQNVIKNFANEDMLFLSVGFGKDADVDTLKEMSQAFNKGKSFIPIGLNQKLVFYRAENQKELMDAFTVYEKFFDYQENLQETKRNMLTSYLANQEKAFEQNLKFIELIDRKNEEALDACRLQDEKLADNLDKVNERFEARMDTCRQLIDEISKEEKKLENEKSNHETKKTHLQETKKSIEEKARIQNDNLNYKLKTYQTFNNLLNEKREKAIQALKDDTNFNMVLGNIAKLGIEIKEEQKDQFSIDYKSFIQNYNLFLQQLQELKKNSDAITLLFDEILAICEVIRKQQTTAINIATGEELSNKLWSLFCEYFFNDQSPSQTKDAEMPKKAKVHISSQTKDAEMLKKLIISKMQERDVNDPKIYETFNMIFDYESVRQIFANIEQSRRKNEKYVDGFVDKMKNHIEKDIVDLNDMITVSKEEINDENKQVINAEIDALKKALADKKNQKLNIIRYGAHMRKILGLLDQMINEVREKYLDTSLKKSFKKSFTIFQKSLNPQVHILVDGFRSADHDAFTSSTSNSIQSSLKKSAIKN